MMLNTHIGIIKNKKFSASLMLLVLALPLFVIILLSQYKVQLFASNLLLGIAIFYIFSVLLFALKNNQKSNEFSVPTISDYPTVQERAALPAVPRSWSIRLLTEMEWKKFEQLCLAYFHLKDVNARLIEKGTHGYIELRLHQTAEVNAIAKHTTSIKDIGVKEIKELLALMARAQVSKGFYMTASSFSSEAKAFAKEHKVTLISGGMLLTMLKRLRSGEQKRLLAMATEGDYRTPTCPACNVKMISRHGPHQDKYYWGCIYKPRCKHIMPRRAQRAEPRQDRRSKIREGQLALSV